MILFFVTHSVATILTPILLYEKPYDAIFTNKHSCFGVGNMHDPGSLKNKLKVWKMANWNFIAS